MPRLSNNDRNQALGMLRAGISTREVARLFNCHQSTVVRLRQRFKTMNNVSDRPRTGQPRATTDQQDRHIRLQHLRNRFKIAASAARETPKSDLGSITFKCNRLHYNYFAIFMITLH